MGLLLSVDFAQRLRRGDDRDVLISLEREQIVIAGDDEIGTRRERCGEHMIVIGIARDLRHGIRLDDNGDVEIAREQFIERQSAALDVFDDDVNLYAYVKNDPLSATDPTGEAEYRVLYGEPGLGKYNVGGNFRRAAETRAAELRAEGHHVTVAAVATTGEFNAAITSGAMIDGGVDYFGHGGAGSLYPGENAGAETNIDADNVGELSGRNLADSATVTLNACYSGAGGSESIAQLMADRLGVSVKGSERPLGFTGEKGVYLHGKERRPPDSGPLYLTPPKEENWKTFEPR